MAADQRHDQPAAHTEQPVETAQRIVADYQCRDFTKGASDG